MDKIALIAALTEEEGSRSLVYDDAAGKTLAHDYTLRSNPTIAVGRASLS